jgi:hypothetical protein
MFNPAKTLCHFLHHEADTLSIKLSYGSCNELLVPLFKNVKQMYERIKHGWNKCTLTHKLKLFSYGKMSLSNEKRKITEIA